MVYLSLWSDHINKGSDIYARSSIFYLTKTSHTVIAADNPACFKTAFTRLAGRTLQTLRQARLQMCQGSRAWPQILFDGELFRPISSDGLCPPGRSCQGRRIFKSPSQSSRAHRGCLRNQPRTLTPPRGVLRRVDELTYSCDRCAGGRCADCQYARGLAYRQSPTCPRGGSE